MYIVRRTTALLFLSHSDHCYYHVSNNSNSSNNQSFIHLSSNHSFSFSLVGLTIECSNRHPHIFYFFTYVSSPSIYDGRCKTTTVHLFFIPLSVLLLCTTTTTGPFLKFYIMLSVCWVESFRTSIKTPIITVWIKGKNNNCCCHSC